MAKITDSKLIKFQQYISFEEAAEFLSRLIEEEVGADTFGHIAMLRIPMFIMLAEEFLHGNFIGFKHENLKKIWPSKEELYDDSQFVRIRKSDGSIPDFDYWSMSLPVPLGFDSTYPGVGLTENSSGEPVYWFVWIEGDDELVSFSWSDREKVQFSVRPEDVYNLALMINDESIWPDQSEGCVSEGEAYARLSHDGKEVMRSAKHKPLIMVNSGWVDSTEAAQPGTPTEISVSASSHLVIAGMLQLIKQVSNHTQSSIQDYIFDEFKGARGTSKSNLEKLFRTAKTAAAEVKD